MVESSSTGVAAQLTIPARVKTIKAHLNKARQYEDKSGQHYISAGLHLAELKDWHKRELKTGGGQSWAKFVREQFDLGQSRADQLIRISAGLTTVEETRADTAKRVQKHAQAKISAIANADIPMPMIGAPMVKSTELVFVNTAPMAAAILQANSTDAPNTTASINSTIPPGAVDVDVAELRDAVDELQVELMNFTDRFEPWSDYGAIDIRELVLSLKAVRRLAQALLQEIESCVPAKETSHG